MTFFFSDKTIEVMTSYKTGSRKWKVYPAANKQHMFQFEKSSNSVREKRIGSNPSGNPLFDSLAIPLKLSVEFHA